MSAAVTLAGASIMTTANGHIHVGAGVGDAAVDSLAGAARALREAAAALALVSPQFARRALDPQRDAAGRHVDLALVALAAAFTIDDDASDVGVPGRNCGNGGGSSSRRRFFKTVENHINSSLNRSSSSTTSSSTSRVVEASAAPAPRPGSTVAARTRWSLGGAGPRVMRWLRLRHTRFVLVLVAAGLSAAAAGLAATGRGTRGGAAHRRRACAAGLAAAREAARAVGREAAACRPVPVIAVGRGQESRETASLSAAAAAPVEVVELVLYYVARQVWREAGPQSTLVSLAAEPDKWQPAADAHMSDRERRGRRLVGRAATAIASVCHGWRVAVAPDAWRHVAVAEGCLPSRLHSWVVTAARALSDQPLVDASASSEVVGGGETRGGGGGGGGEARRRVRTPRGGGGRPPTAVGADTAGVVGWGALGWVRVLDLLKMQLFEPRDTLVLRSLADWCTGLVDLRLYVTAMSWPTLQHVLMVAGGGGASAARVSGEGGRGLRSLSLRGSIDLRVSGGGVGPPSGGSFSMTKEARARLRALECLDLDLADDWLYRSPGVQGGDHDRLTRRVAAVATTAVTGGDETVWDESATVVPDGSTLRARTVAASQWILEQVGHAHMVRLRVRVPVRVPAGTVDRILAACVDGGGEVSRMRELWLDRVRLNERHVGVGGVLAGRSVAGGVDDDETTNSGFMQAGPAGFTRDGGGVPSMPFLSVLCLANTDVGDAGLAAIAAGRAGRLRALNVSATMVTDVGVRLVAASFAAVATVAATGDTGLRELYMDELPVSVGAVDQLLAAVGRGLEVLSLHGVQATPGRTMASVVRWCGGGVGTAGPVQSRLRRLDVFSATLWGQQVHGPDVAPGRVVRLLRACRQLEDLVIDFELFKRWIEQAKEADEAEVAAAAATTTRGAGGATGREDRASGPRAGALEGAFEMPLYMMRNFRAWWLAETPNDEEADEDDEGGNGGGGGGGGGSDPWWWADAFLSGPAGFAGDSNSGSHGNASTSDAHGGRLRHRRQRWRTAAASALAAELTRRFPRLDLDTNVSKVRLLYGGHLAAEGLLWGRERGWV